MFTNIKTTDTEITFSSDIETRTMTLKAGDEKTVATVNFKIKGNVSLEKAIKTAVDKAIINFRDNAKKGYSYPDDTEKWMDEFDGKTIALDLDVELTANERTSNPLKRVSKQIAKTDNDKLYAAALAQNPKLTREQFDAALAIFTS